MKGGSDMKLDSKEFKRFKELSAKVKAGKATEAEKAELDKLLAKKNTTGSNDLQWWANYPDLLKGVTNIPFNWIPGTKVGVTNNSANFAPLNIGNIAIAKLTPAIGQSTTDADAFNSQIRQLWLDMHRKYRGIGTYQKADLGMMILGINSYFEVLAKFERIYGVINTYHIGNRVVPNGLKDALGISADLEENLADFRYILNLYIAKAKQICLPKGLSILASDLVAVSNLFKDSKDRRAFIFGFDISEFGVFRGDLVNSSSQAIGSAVVFEDFSSLNYMTGTSPSNYPAFTLADVKGVLETMISHLLNDDDVQTMCSDLLAAYGPENVMTLVSVPEDYHVEPVEDYERSLQFHNLSIIGSTESIYVDSVIDNTMANVFSSNNQRHVYYQYQNKVMCELAVGHPHTNNYVLVSGRNVPSFFASEPEYDEYGKVTDLVFDTWAETPGDIEVMCGTRYMALAGPTMTVTSSSYRRFIYSYGSKVVEKLEVWAYRPANNDYFREIIYGSVIEDSKFNSSKEVFFHLGQMDWAPLFYVNDSGDYTLVGDVDNFTVITNVNLERIHEVALLSGYKIPMVSQG